MKRSVWATSRCDVNAGIRRRRPESLPSRKTDCVKFDRHFMGFLNVIETKKKSSPHFVVDNVLEHRHILHPSHRACRSELISRHLLLMARSVNVLTLSYSFLESVRCEFRMTQACLFPSVRRPRPLSAPRLFDTDPPFSILLLAVEIAESASRGVVDVRFARACRPMSIRMSRMFMETLHRKRDVSLSGVGTDGPSRRIRVIREHGRHSLFFLLQLLIECGGRPLVAPYGRRFRWIGKDGHQQ